MPTTKEQRMAQKAFARVNAHTTEERFNFKEYRSFAMSFPTMIHSSGLVQAVAFAQAKNQAAYLSDINAVFAEIDHAGALEDISRSAGLTDYMRITLHALSAASWLKRYCQAVRGVDDEDEQLQGNS